MGSGLEYRQTTVTRCVDSSPPVATVPATEKMTYETILPDEDRRRLDDETGWVYVDVRSVEEFAAGHPRGAYNIPIASRDPAMGSLVFNPEFLEVLQRTFDTSDNLILDCASGGRSAKACELLAEVGYTVLANMHCGFSGFSHPGGFEPGWQALGFESGEGNPEGKGYDALRC